MEYETSESVEAKDSAVAYAAYKLSELEKRNRGIVDRNVQLLRFAALVAKYLQDVIQEWKYLPISEGIAGEFFNFLDPYLLKNFNVVVPDRLDEYLSDVYKFCEADWNARTKSTILSRSDFMEN